MYGHMHVCVCNSRNQRKRGHRLESWGAWEDFKGEQLEGLCGKGRKESKVIPFILRRNPNSKMCIKVCTYRTMADHINDLSWLSKNVTVGIFSKGVTFVSLYFNPDTNSTVFSKTFSFTVQTNVFSGLVPCDRLSLYNQGTSSCLSPPSARIIKPRHLVLLKSFLCTPFYAICMRGSTV